MKKTLLTMGAVVCLLTACNKTENHPDSQQAQTGSTHQPLAKGKKDEKMLSGDKCVKGGGGCIEITITGRCPSLMQADIFRQLDNGKPTIIKNLFANAEENRYLPAEMLEDDDFMQLVNGEQVSSKLLLDNGATRVYAFGTEVQLAANQHIYAVPFN